MSGELGRTTVGGTFSGIGGMELAAERSGMNVRWSCEINPDARSVLSNRFPSTLLHGDIAEIGYGPDATVNVEPVDLLCGGFPCQDLSVAGRRAGLAGGRSGLFFEFARLADEIAPTWIVLENVPGLLSSNDGRDMGTVVGTLGELGYGVAWRVLDAQNFGVPQRRRRVVIVGHLGEVRRAGQVLFEPESGSRDSAPGTQQGARVAGTLAASFGSGGYGGIGQSASAITSRIVESRGIPAVAPAPTTRCGNTQDDQQSGQLVPITIGLGSDPIHAFDVAMPVTCRHGDPGVVFNPHRTGSSRTWIHDEPGRARSLTANKTLAVHERDAVRRLTPTECERLQGFPDGWTDIPNRKGKPMADSARYRMLGNAVAVPVFEWVFGRIVGGLA